MKWLATDIASVSAGLLVLEPAHYTAVQITHHSACMFVIAATASQHLPIWHMDHVSLLSIDPSRRPVIIT